MVTAGVDFVAVVATVFRFRVAPTVAEVMKSNYS